MSESDGEQAEISQLQNAINRYLVKHPFAADTIEGVCHWWLMGSGINAPRDKVSAALDKLVQAGLIEKSDMPDGREIYALVKRKH